MYNLFSQSETICCTVGDVQLYLKSKVLWYEYQKLIKTVGDVQLYLKSKVLWYEYQKLIKVLESKGGFNFTFGVQ